MKIREVLIGALALIVTVVMLPAGVVNADETSNGDEATNGSILLTRGTSPAIISAPEFNFGTHLTLATAMKFYAESGTTSGSGDSVNAPAQTSDDQGDATTTATMSIPMNTNSMQLVVRNPGYNSGWRVSVTSGQFVRTSDQRELKGAVLTVGNKDAVTTDASNQVSLADTDGDDSNQVTAEEANQDPAGKPESPIASSSGFKLVLGSDSAATPIFTASADKNQGVGTWALNFGSDNVSLDVPAGNVVGDYVANLTWTMTNAPQ